MPEHGLGRRREFDQRSKQYPIQSLLAAGARTVSRTWPCASVLDQGVDGACVGFSWAHELISEPDSHDVDDKYAIALYHRAQQLDNWPGEDYVGSSVLAGAKAVQETMWLVEYRWAFGWVDVLDTLSQFGPVVLGINWYSSMFTTQDGWISVNPDSGVAGGHAILCRGIDVDRKGVLLHNSWGPQWGDQGAAWLSWLDLQYLLSDDGEACVPVVRDQIAPGPTPPLVPAPPKKAGCLSWRTVRSFLASERP